MCAIDKKIVLSRINDMPREEIRSETHENKALMTLALGKSQRKRVANASIKVRKQGLKRSEHIKILDSMGNRNLVAIPKAKIETQSKSIWLVRGGSFVIVSDTTNGSDGISLPIERHHGCGPTPH
jgi:hypothetical protein